MSMKLVVACWEVDLDKTSLLLLMALCDSARDDGTRCYPDVPYLVWKTKESRATVFRILEQLEAAHILEAVGMHGRATHYTIHLEHAPRKAAYIAPKMGRPRILQREKKSSHHETTFPDSPPTAMKSQSHGETIQSHGETIQSHGETIQSHGETIQSHGETDQRCYDVPPAQAQTGADDSKHVRYPVMIQSLTSHDPDTPPVFVKQTGRAEPDLPLRWGEDGMPELSGRLRAFGVRRLRTAPWSMTKNDIAHDRPVSFEQWERMHYWAGALSSQAEREREYKRFETAIIARRAQREIIAQHTQELAAEV